MSRKKKNAETNETIPPEAVNESATIVFAVELVRTTQGWFRPGHPLPRHDLPDEELTELLEKKDAVLTSVDSPIAVAARAARALPEPDATRVIRESMAALLASYAEQLATDEHAPEPEPESDPEDKPVTEPEDKPVTEQE